MRSFIKKYVASCSCSRTKHSRHLSHGLLNPLPIPECPWKSIAMDFIVDLPPCQGFTGILVVVDRFSKMAIFIPCGGKNTDSVATAKLFVDHVVRRFGLPADIVSDRGSQFKGDFWKETLRLLGIKRNLSSAFHPQSDGQTERTNAILEQYLRNYVSYAMDDWINWLPLAEFSFNNSVNASTGHTPFYACHGFNPSFDPCMPVTSHIPAATNIREKLDQVIAEIREHLAKAQENAQRYANRRRMDFNPEVGQKVWLLTKNLQSRRPCKKLDYLKIGPYEIVERINNVAFRLKLPDSVRIHDVFHVSLLEPFVANPFPSRTVAPPPPEIIDGDEEFEVEEILDSRRVGRGLQYLVRWTGYSPSDDSWQPARDLTHCQDLVNDFHLRHPDKPRLAPP